MDPFTEIEAARTAIATYTGSAEDFALPIAGSLNDPMGMNMAILLDALLARGWEPAGFEQQDGYRIYRYARME